MNLKESRFDIICDFFDYLPHGCHIDVDKIPKFIEYQRRQFGVTDTQILEMIVEQLS